MKRSAFRGSAALAAVGVTAALALSACGGGDENGGGDGAFDQASNAIVNASDKKGGTLNLLRTGDFDSTDPGNMYYATAWNFSRLYARPLLTFKSVAGQGNLDIVPDLATGLGQASPDQKTWTYKLRTGVKFADGTPVTAKDVKYAVARSNYSPEVMEKGPVYFRQYLENPNGYKGPYKDPNLDNFKGVTTPDDQTVVFHLAKPFAEFDYLATIPQTAPVPKAADTGDKGGVNYAKSVVSTGPYKIDKYEPGKSISLSKNPNWDTSDPNRKQLVDKIEVQLGVAADEVDNRQMDGSAHIDVQGNGVNAAARSKILSDPELKKNADNPKSGFLWYTAISRQVAPFDNVECRKAVQYAVDKTAYQAAYGGTTGGDIASTVMPPSLKAYQKFNLYETPGDKGDVAKAKEHLKACGKPDGFSTSISYRTERPKEKAAAESVKASLEKVGIKVDIKNYPEDGYTGGVVGDPKFVKKNNLGLMVYGWAADFPSGFGFLQQITDPGALKGTGSSNISHIDLPEIAKMFQDVPAIKDEAGRNKVYQEIDKKVMEDASIIPMLYAKNLYYRNPKVSNVFINYGYSGMYDYANLGLK
ncbi:ABC transporter substrate-binding protein [Actinomadura macrotermitis]|uniref:Putative D,D-dipeptide-binding periplasmic protein DdpA n=1 Tax=Actinomadura macrotermitis TaxID=2585200 RepID=A0A7K0C5D5_9ACTN|nr:ABC transporter substrate-binding protein [Actinomadura macrotermitis]MQY08661.1 putative D,D-dipeptide-binding periplasmic protein DdpA [Actinomadura macrotermitis]